MPIESALFVAAVMLAYAVFGLALAWAAKRAGQPSQQ